MIKRDRQVFVLVGARVYEVTAIFCDPGKANDHMAVHRDQGVIAVDETDGNTVIFLAQLTDKGRTP